MWTTVWRQSGTKQILQRGLEVEEVRTLHFYIYEHLHAGNNNNNNKSNFREAQTQKILLKKSPMILKHL